LSRVLARLGSRFARPPAAVEEDSPMHGPERNYPDVMYGGGVERMDDGACVHE
jgi:hypothetical protein